MMAANPSAVIHCQLNVVKAVVVVRIVWDLLKKSFEVLDLIPAFRMRGFYSGTSSVRVHGVTA